MKENKDKQPWWLPAVTMFARFSAWIFAPVVIGAFLGKWLDKKFGSEPILFLITVGFAFLISMFGLIKEVSREYEKIEIEKNNSSKQKTQNNKQG